jgi:thiamine-monophosphate kinase
MVSEDRILEIVSGIFEPTTNTTPKNTFHVDIGDDAAITLFPTNAIVSAADLAVENVHFTRTWSTPYEIGARTVVANLADIYSMGAVPIQLLVSVTIPNDFSEDEIAQLAQGIREEADRAGVRVVGGDISRATLLVVSISAMGSPINHNIAERRFLRSAVKPGNSIVVSQLPGASRIGYEILASGKAELIAKYPHFVAQFKKPEINYQQAHAMGMLPIDGCIDVSDGLLSELMHLCTASGVDIELAPDFWTNSPQWELMRAACADLAIDPIDVVLTGGEDHCFVMTSNFASLLGGIEIGKAVVRQDSDDVQAQIQVGEKSFNKNSFLGWRH